MRDEEQLNSRTRDELRSGRTRERDAYLPELEEELLEFLALGRRLVALATDELQHVNPTRSAKAKRTTRTKITKDSTTLLREWGDDKCTPVHIKL
jgi:hypothetical protein